MRAVVLRRPEDGSGPRRADFIADHPEPTPRADEVLVHVELAGICATDLELLRGYMDFVGVPGHEFIGTVLNGPRELCGRRVVCEINCPCGQCDMCDRSLPGHCRRRSVIGIAGRDGCFAERIAVPRRNCHLVPDSLSNEQAVFVEPLAAAIRVLHQVAVGPETRAAVVGSGRLGTLVAQVLARRTERLTVVGRNPRTLDYCARLGLAAVHAGRLEARADFDLVVECSGSPDGLALALDLVRPLGTIVLKSTCAERTRLDLAPLVVHEISLIGSRCGPFDEALEWLAAGRVQVSAAISAVFPLERALEAFAAADDPANLKVLFRPGGR